MNEGTDKNGEASGAPVRWDLLDDRLLQACRVWDLRARRYRHPGSAKEGEFFYLDSRDWAIVVAETPERGLVLVRQFRWGADELSWEFPGGVVDRGEDPVEAGLRELNEETGYRAEKGRKIGQCRPNPAILNNHCHIIFAENAVWDAGGTDWDEHEELEIRVLPAATVVQWSREYVFEHALALVGLLYYQLERKE